MRRPTARTTRTIGALATAVALIVPLQAASAAGIAPAPGQPAAVTLDPLPNLPVNACNDSTLPRDYGTNFPVPNDPSGFGFANQTVIGWEGNIYAPFEYLSGSYFARGVPQKFTQGNSNYCGAMYSFGVYNYGLAAGQAPAPGSVQWSMANGYLPAMTTSFTRNNVAISITDFASKQTIAGNPAELVYTRVQVTNNGSAAVSVPSGQSGPNLVELDNASNTVQPGQTVDHDFVAAVDTFTVGGTLPTVADLTSTTSHSAAESYDSAFSDMSSFWNGRLKAIPILSLPDVSLPNTNGLANPGDAIDNAYKAAFIYTRIVQVDKSPFSGANNYAWLLNHDLPGMLANRFELGDFTDAQNLLLTGRISEVSNFNEVGANWYWDGVWRTPIAWAEYLQGTGDTAFVSQYFHDDATAPSQWGPSLFTMMHTDLLAQLSATTLTCGGRMTTTPAAPGCSTTRPRSPGSPPTPTSPTRSASRPRRSGRRASTPACSTRSTPGSPPTRRPTASISCRVKSTCRSRPTGAAARTTPTGPRRCSGARTPGTSSCRAASSAASSATRPRPTTCTSWASPG